MAATDGMPGMDGKTGLEAPGAGSGSALSRGDPGLELVDEVDGEDQVIRTITRREMRQRRCLHRAVYIAVSDPVGRIWVQRRSPFKDYCPGMLDACAGGVVSSGEDYDRAAVRELAEETGITGEALVPCGVRLLQARGGGVFGGIYFLRTASRCLPLDGEVTEYLLMTPGEIRQRREEFTPDGLEALEAALVHMAGSGF